MSAEELKKRFQQAEAEKAKKIEEEKMKQEEKRQKAEERKRKLEEKKKQDLSLVLPTTSSQENPLVLTELQQIHTNINQIQTEVSDLKNSFYTKLEQDIQKQNEILEKLLSVYGTDVKHSLSQFQQFQKDIQENTPEAIQKRVIFSFLINFHSNYKKIADSWKVRRMNELLYFDLKNIISQDQFMVEVWQPMIEAGLLESRKEWFFRFRPSKQGLEKYAKEINEHPSFGLEKNRGVDYYINKLGIVSASERKKSHE